MSALYISKQKILNNKNELYGYELHIHNDPNVADYSSENVKNTAKLVISALSSMQLNALLSPKTFAFITIDDATLTRGIIDLLDKDKVVLNLHEDIHLSEAVINKIVQYKKRGFRFALEHFDSSAKMISKFSKILNFIDIIKMDTIASELENLAKIVQKFRGTHIKLLAQNIETNEDYQLYLEMGFDFFEGYYLDEPQIIEITGTKEPIQFIVLQLLKIIKEDNSGNEKLEFFIKKQPDLSFKLIQFFNSSKKLDVKVESLIQVLALLGRDKLLRWLLVYLYSELSTTPASKTILELALKRAESMEAEADIKNKDKAYLAGMFSLLDAIFETDMKELFKQINMDSDISALILERKGIFLSSLIRAEKAEKDYLKKLFLENFDKIYTTDLVYTLEYSGIDIDKNKI